MLSAALTDLLMLSFNLSRVVAAFVAELGKGRDGGYGGGEIKGKLLLLRRH